MSVNGTLVEAKMCTFILESTHFILMKCSIYTLDGASAKFNTNSHGTDYSVFFCMNYVVKAGGQINYILFYSRNPPSTESYICIVAH